MNREKIFSNIQKLRTCIVRVDDGMCNHSCDGCIYQTKDEELVETLDALISMYRPRKQSLKEKMRIKKKLRQMRMERIS